MKRTENINCYTMGERQALIYHYLLENSNKDHVVPTQRLIDYLDTCDIKIHINTLYNDIETIQSIYKVTIEYDEKMKGYRLKDTLFKPYEIRLIAHAVQSSKFITERTAGHLISQLKKLTDAYTASSISSDAYVVDRIHSQNESVIPHIERLHQAIQENSQIKFKYFAYVPFMKPDKIYYGKGQYLTVSPIKLVWLNGSLYLYAGMFQTKVGIISHRYYAVERMESITKPLGIPREGVMESKDFSNSIMKNITIFEMDDLERGGRVYDVKMRFSKIVISSVVDRFGTDIMMIPDGGDFIITQKVHTGPNFFAWIASFGILAQILEPKPVVKAMKRFLDSAIEMYKEDEEP